MTHHKLTSLDKKSHYTALMVGVVIGAMASSVVLVAVAIANSAG